MTKRAIEETPEPGIPAEPTKGPMPSMVDDTDILPDEHWARLKQHHAAAAASFIHIVLAGIEVVCLKLALPHGKFAKAAAEMVQDLSPRTIRNYRQVGEQYLSAFHSRAVTVKLLKKANRCPTDGSSSEENVEEYLTRNQIGSVEKLKQLAETIVPELKKRIKVPRAHRVERLFAKVKKSWVGMTPEQQSDFDKRFSDLRNSTKTPVTA